MTDNSKTKSVVAHSSYMDIYNVLYNNMKNDDQTSNQIVVLLLEFKEIIHSKDDTYLIVDHLSKRVDTCKTLFTTMKDNNINNLTKSPKKIIYRI